jgi:hypothetical protein
LNALVLTVHWIWDQRESFNGGCSVINQQKLKAQQYVGIEWKFLLVVTATEDSRSEVDLSSSVFSDAFNPSRSWQQISLRPQDLDGYSQFLIFKKLVAMVTAAKEPKVHQIRTLWLVVNQLQMKLSLSWSWEAVLRSCDFMRFNFMRKNNSCRLSAVPFENNLNGCSDEVYTHWSIFLLAFISVTDLSRIMLFQNLIFQLDKA